MATQEKFNAFINLMFNLQLTNKLYHWNTTSFARHKATDGFDDVLGDLLDRFVEVFSGRYNLKPMVSKVSINQNDLTDDGIVALFENIRNVLQRNLTILMNDTDLLNIRDELLAEVNKTLYLFRLK